MQTRMGTSTVTTHADGTVVKQFESGLTQRHIPMSSGEFMITEQAPNGTLTMTLPDGTRMLESPTGRMYSFEPDGSYEIQRQTGLRLNVSPDDPSNRSTNDISQRYKRAVSPSMKVLIDT